METGTRRPVVFGAADQKLVAHKAAHSAVARNFEGLQSRLSTAGRFLLPAETPEDLSGTLFHGVPDGNRSVVIPEVTVELGGRSYALGVKGVGARSPLYGDSPLEFAFGKDFADSGGSRLEGPRQLTAETWFGESPYGAQGPVPASYGLEISELATGASINGFHICPVVEVCELSEGSVAAAAHRFWYRRHRGPYLQEQRLVPSNVRVYHQSEMTLGRATRSVLDAFGVSTTDTLDAFIDRFISSGIAALTLFVRSARESKWGLQGLDYTNVWLDKDCLVAADGTLHFADLEGLEWVVAGHDWSLEERVREQFDRNFYEFMYGLDALLRHRESMAGRSPSQHERRCDLVARYEMALGTDRFARAELSDAGVDILVRTPLRARDEVTLRLLDLR